MNILTVNLFPNEVLNTFFFQAHKKRHISHHFHHFHLIYVEEKQQKKS